MDGSCGLKVSRTAEHGYLSGAVLQPSRKIDVGREPGRLDSIQSASMAGGRVRSRTIRPRASQKNYRIGPPGGRRGRAHRLVLRRPGCVAAHSGSTVVGHLISGKPVDPSFSPAMRYSMSSEIAISSFPSAIEHHPDGVRSGLKASVTIDLPSGSQGPATSRPSEMTGRLLEARTNVF